MKYFLFFAVLFVLASSFRTVSIDEVVKAIKAGNASEVSKYFDNTVEITLSGKSNSYSKNQATLILRDFFASNAVKDFEILHKSDNSNSQYCIGNLKTANGIFRTTIFMKQKGYAEVIQSLGFEK